MKRASLKSVKVSVLATPSPDVTDQFLKADGDSAPRQSRFSDKPRARARAASSSPTRVGSPPASPSSADSQSPDPITHALTLTQSALEALYEARTSAPARYDLGVRIRLDALAHHIEQVTQYIVHQSY